MGGLEVFDENVVTEFFVRFSRKENEYICANKSIASNPMIPLHKHDFMEISYVQKGSAVHVINGVKVEVKEGDVFFVSYGSIHTFEDNTNDFAWINCLFLPESFVPGYQRSPYIEDLFKTDYFDQILSGEESVTKYIHLFDVKSEFEKLFTSLFSEYYNGKAGYKVLCRAILTNILIKVCRMHMNKSNQGKKKDINLLDVVYDYFKLTSSFENIKMEEIAKKLYMNPDYFSRLFKKRTGMKFSAFVRNMRVEYAAMHLRSTDMNVSEIMNYVGYSDSKNFYEAFKAKYGMTPSAYRKYCKENVDI